MKVLFILGIIIVMLAIVDIVWTTLWIDGGAGFVTSKLSNIIWKLVSKLPIGKGISGPFILISVLFNWVFLLWLGWTFVFASNYNSIASTLNNSALVWQNFIYYSGYTIFTLGSGDYAPTSPLWQILTNLASGTGTLFLALGASYILTIVGAVVDKRIFASQLFSIGHSSEEIMLTAWNGKDFNEINSLLLKFSDEISALSVKHKAYPLLHYYHTRNKKEVAALAIPVIDNTLSIMEYGIVEEAKPNPLLLKKARMAVENYLDTLEGTYINIPNEPFILPDLNQLKKENLPVVENAVFKMEMEKLKERRQKLLGLLSEDMWDTDDLTSV